MGEMVGLRLESDLDRVERVLDVLSDNTGDLNLLNVRSCSFPPSR